MNFQDDITSIPIDNFKDHYVLVFKLTSMQDATEKFHYPDLVEERLRLELNFTFPLKHVIELLVMGERMPSVAVDNIGVVGKVSETDNVSLQQIINCTALINYRYLLSSPSDYVPFFHKETFAIINTQPSNIQEEQWIIIANSTHKLYSADAFDQPSFLNEQYKQMMPEPLQSHPSVCGSYGDYAVFHLFKFQQEEITGPHDVSVL